MPPLGKGGNAIHNVAAAADFQDVAPERVGALFGDDYWRFGLVFRPGGLPRGLRLLLPGSRLSWLPLPVLGS
ncbi:hypothetical protein Pyn_29713 [Prunus yedoensis var. nudiflora]|uniref:Uncharacterized protein n=1 Tax=Prunus yedoensis var. nudiflora TaxID=2094558 RepID=A0A314YJP9_PRUYE|nr:hypothetical protein Pyn_29713 [Prunus yedoensis var. nudiflora]